MVFMDLGWLSLFFKVVSQFHGSLLVFMAFLSSFTVFHGSWLVFMVIQGSFTVLWLLVGFNGFSR